MNTERVVEGLNLMQSLYFASLEHKKKAQSLIFSADIVEKEHDRINQTHKDIFFLFPNLKKRVEGDTSITFTKKDSIDFKKVLGYCANYLSSIERVYPVFSSTNEPDPDFGQYNIQLKEKSELVNNVFKELRQNKII